VLVRMLGLGRGCRSLHEGRSRLGILGFGIGLWLVVGGFGGVVVGIFWWWLVFGGLLLVVVFLVGML